MLLWASVEFTGDACKFWMDYRECKALDPLLKDWDTFKHEFIHLSGNRLSKQEAQGKLLDLRHTSIINEYLNDILTLDWETQIGTSFFISLIRESLKPPNDSEKWVEWIRNMGRTDQAAYKCLKGQDHPLTRTPAVEIESP